VGSNDAQLLVRSHERNTSTLVKTVRGITANEHNAQLPDTREYVIQEARQAMAPQNALIGTL